MNVLDFFIRPTDLLLHLVFVAGIILLHVGSVKPSQNPNYGWFFRVQASDLSFYSDAKVSQLVDKPVLFYFQRQREAIV